MKYLVTLSLFESYEFSEGGSANLFAFYKKSDKTDFWYLKTTLLSSASAVSLEAHNSSFSLAKSADQDWTFSFCLYNSVISFSKYSPLLQAKSLETAISIINFIIYNSFSIIFFLFSFTLFSISLKFFLKKDI